MPNLMRIAASELILLAPADHLREEIGRKRHRARTAVRVTPSQLLGKSQAANHLAID